MDIQIRLDDLHPPVGDVSTDAGPPQTFSGWLGLLGVLSDLLERTPGAGGDQLRP